MRKLVCALVLAACSSSPGTGVIATPPTTAPEPPPVTIPTAPAPNEKVMTADTPFADTDGNTFIVPAGWKVSALDTLTTLTAPEATSQIAMYDTTAATPEAARDAAWKAFRPDAKWPLLTTTARPDRDG